MAVTVTYDFQLLQSFEFPTGPAVGTVDLVGLANGGFAVVAESNNGFSSIEIFDGALALTGARGEFTDSNPGVIQLPSGNLVVVATSTQDTGTLGILDQNADIIDNVTPFTPAGDGRVVDVAALTTGGNFVVVTGYSRSDGDNDAEVVEARIFNGAGTELLNIPVYETAQSSLEPVVAALDAGGFVVAWERTNTDSSVELSFQIYNANGSPRGTQTEIDSSSTSGMGRMAITATDGGFAVVYEDDTVSANTDISIRRFDANGNLLPGGGTLTGPGTIDRTPAIARMPDGLLAVSLSFANISTADMETFAGIFDPATGTFLAQRTALIGNPITDNTVDPAIAGFGQGRLALFHRNATDNDVDGEALEVVRISTGDSTGEFFDPSSYRDIQNGGGGSDFLDGGGNNDTLDGGAGGDNLFGGAGNDILIGGSETDTALYTGTAAVTVNLSLAGAQNTGGAGTDTLSGIENVIGGNGNDTLTGNTLANRLDGGAGGDTLSGGAGDDIIIGGDGVDIISGGNNNDLLDGGAAGDALNGGANVDTVTYAGSASRVEVRLSIGAGTFGDAAGDSYTGVENVIGSAFNDTIVGSDAIGNVLNGGGGVDTILGRGGADVLNGDAGDDLLDGGAGGDVLNGGADIDTISYAGSTARVEVRLSTGAGTFGDAAGDSYGSIENVVGSGFDDVIVGDNLPGNILSGGAGADTLLGRGGSDTLNGEAGADLLDGGTGADVLNGGADSDTVSYAGSSAGVQVRLTTGAGLGGDAQGDALISIENLTGSAFADTLVGSNAVNNKLDGGNGADTMIGNSGNDVLTGGLGKDTLLGGVNNDAFVFASAADSAVGANRDTIFDFEDAGENDSIVLTGFAGVLSFIGTAAFSAANQVRAIQSGANVLVQINTTGTSGAESEILLANTALAQIDATDFFL